MCESPQSLQNICLDVISEHIAEITNDEEETNSKFLFQNLNVYLHREVSEQLLQVLSKKKYLNDKTLCLFDPRHTRLEKVKINNAAQITLKGLKTLRLHKITDLEVTDLDNEITVNELIGCLGEWTLQNIKNLNVRNNSFTTHSKFCVVVSLSKLRNLKTLNVSSTEFNGHGLEIVTEDLPCLENLDISETRVKDISPLQLCKHRLKSLNLYNLKLINGSEFVPLICSMEHLRHLDISNDKDHPFHMFKSSTCNEASLLKNYKALPNLISLDLSGKEKIDAEDLREQLASSVPYSREEDQTPNLIYKN
ncbi:ZYG11B [Cordylochernes scorpioides]|uniref:ZYG11B n=1 Tax=Cordylochernes scorpioides TaxID=51811 RepID=A0ABY6LJ18_9ARAC|nr:ZYG11B [Cordylochernes scorpioides]